MPTSIAATPAMLTSCAIADGAEHQRVRAQRLGEEPPERIEADVGEEQRARRARQAIAKSPQQEREDRRVPQRLVEKRRVEVLGLRVLDRAVGGRDVELPRKRGRRAERLLVEEVAPAPDGLSEREARRRDVEIAEQRQPAAPRVHAADEDPAQHAAVDGQAAFPHGEDLRRLTGVVLEVEGDVVEAGAHQAAEERELRGLEQRLRIESAAHCIAVGEPEPDGHRARHEDAVPAEGEGADLDSDGARGPEHQARIAGPGRRPGGVITVPLYGSPPPLSNKTTIWTQIN